MSTSSEISKLNLTPVDDNNNQKFAETFVNPPGKKLKVLLVIGGVTQELYALNEIIALDEGKNYQRRWIDNNQVIAYGNENAYYYLIKEINAEQYFDSKILKFFSGIFLLGLPAFIWDKAGDYFKAIFNKKKMELVSILVTKEIMDIKRTLGAEVHLIGHSLGSLLALSAIESVDKVVLMGSPVSSKSKTVRNSALNHLKEYWHLIASEKYFFWSLKDFFCCSPAPLENFVSIESFGTHKFKDYLRRALDKGILILKKEITANTCLPAKA